MFRAGFASSGALIVFLATITIAGSQEPPTAGTYQIQSGFYTEVGGIASWNGYPLPWSPQSFVSLVVSNDTGLADLSFLDASRQHPFFIRLTNGVVSGNTIRYHYATRLPMLGVPAWADYTVTNAAGHLWISGSTTSSPVCCDIPYRFEHRDVQAAFMPVLSIRVDQEVELRWSSASNQNYQVQYASDLSQLGWKDLDGLVQGTGGTNSLLDNMGPTDHQRVYRILTLP